MKTRFSLCDAMLLLLFDSAERAAPWSNVARKISLLCSLIEGAIDRRHVWEMSRRRFGRRPATLGKGKVGKTFSPSSQPQPSIFPFFSHSLAENDSARIAGPVGAWKSASLMALFDNICLLFRPEPDAPNIDSTRPANQKSFRLALRPPSRRTLRAETTSWTSSASGLLKGLLSRLS